jgi:hypothetical protein
MALVSPARNGCAPTPTSGRKNLLSPSGWVEPAPPNDGDARKPRTGAASAVGGTRATNPCSIRILVSASRLSDCPTGAPGSRSGSTPSSAGWTAPKRGPLNGRAPMAPGPLPPNGCEPVPTSGRKASGRKVGLTPSSAGWTPPKRGWTPALDDRPSSRGALIPSGEGRPPLSGSRALSIPGRSHFCGSGAPRGPSTRDGPAQRPRKPGLMFAAGVPPPNRARTAASR